VAAVKVNKKISDRATEVLKRLKVIYPEAICELTHDSAFQLLAATILSAQCTDARVNMVTPALFAEFPTAEKLAVANVERVEELVRSTGFYQTKAKNLVGMARNVVDRFGGEVPSAIEDLITLPGVGRKTANVVMNTAFGAETFAVDTHIFRVGNRTGIAPGKTVLAVEKALDKKTPQPFRVGAHHWLILHGRYICKARTPECWRCPVADLCRFKPKTAPPKIKSATVQTDPVKPAA
jgi:endonuclease-3